MLSKKNKKQKSAKLDSESQSDKQWHRLGLAKLQHYIVPIILIPVIALGIKHFTFQLFRVEGTSMETVLTQNDRLIVEKTGRTWASVTRQPYIPKRYEVVVFNISEEYIDQASEKQFVKRVIGLPGERVVVKDQVTRVYNATHPTGIAVDDELGTYLERKVTTVAEAGPDTEENIDLVVPPGQVFVMGDNRGESFDSREMGPIDSNMIVGKMTVRFAPFNRFTIF